jgi:tellurite methyltransferase
MEPDPLLVQAHQDFIKPFFPSAGAALDLAGGIGRHAIWLAQRGWQVTLLDISEIAIAKAKSTAEDKAINPTHIDLQIGDASDFTAPNRYDLIAVFFYLQREIFPELQNSLRPGGLLIYKTYTKLQSQFAGGPSHPMHLLDENELLHAFPSLTVLHYRETIHERGVAEFVGRKRAKS